MGIFSSKRYEETDEPTRPKHHKIVWYMGLDGQPIKIDNKNPDLEHFLCRINHHNEAQLVYKRKGETLRVVPNHRILLVEFPGMREDYFINEL